MGSHHVCEHQVCQGQEASWPRIVFQAADTGGELIPQVGGGYAPDRTVTAISSKSKTSDSEVCRKPNYRVNRTDRKDIKRSHIGW